MLQLNKHYLYYLLVNSLGHNMYMYLNIISYIHILHDIKYIFSEFWKENIIKEL